MNDEKILKNKFNVGDIVWCAFTAGFVPGTPSDENSASIRKALIRKVNGGGTLEEDAEYGIVYELGSVFNASLGFLHSSRVFLKKSDAINFLSETFRGVIYQELQRYFNVYKEESDEIISAAVRECREIGDD